ncbi:MAG: TIGR04282 family arsenosugar biosynthesis glycosyltransferase [Methylococcaceae bacterium]|nr:TIGR04282 family arsenosugar biosynthesis glycosyltransferase [Methylococcaceae bacterium]
MDYLFPDSVLLIFCKAPVPGQVKTRLQAALNAEQAATAHIQLTRFTLDRAFRQTLCPVRLYCAPDAGHQFFKQCAKDYPLKLAAQRGADLGERMLNAFAETLTTYRHAVLIGCDCPSLTIDDLHQALEALQSGHEAVFAPAEDGGYVLIGLNAPQPNLFEDMVWGNETVMAETRRRAAAAKLKVYELSMQWDVDDIEGWKRFLRKK